MALSVRKSNYGAVFPDGSDLAEWNSGFVSDFAIDILRIGIDHRGLQCGRLNSLRSLISGAGLGGFEGGD